MTTTLNEYCDGYAAGYAAGACSDNMRNDAALLDNIETDARIPDGVVSPAKFKSATLELMGDDIMHALADTTLEPYPDGVTREQSLVVACQRVATAAAIDDASAWCHDDVKHAEKTAQFEQTVAELKAIAGEARARE